MLEGREHFLPAVPPPTRLPSILGTIYDELTAGT
jgi:hypothetical protein